MHEPKISRMLLTMARKDLLALQILIEAEHAPDEAKGFHAQQAVEKALKAWLSVLGQEPPRTHNLRLLIMGLEECGINVEHLWDFIELSPFAVQFRYEVSDQIATEMVQENMLEKVQSLIEQVEKALLNGDPDNKR